MGTSRKQEDLEALVVAWAEQMCQALETETASPSWRYVGRPVRRGACAGNNDLTSFTKAQAVGCNC